MFTAFLSVNLQRNITGRLGRKVLGHTYFLNFDTDGVIEHDCAAAKCVARIYGIGFRVCNNVDETLGPLRDFSVKPNFIGTWIDDKNSKSYEEEMKEAQNRGEACFAIELVRKEKRKVTQDSVKKVIDCADKGDAYALCYLAYLYEIGRGVEKDVDKAKDLYGKAEQKGCSHAMNRLGLLLENGNDEDKKKAVALYEKASELGDRAAMLNLGDAYDSGRGVGEDNKTAREWYQKSFDMNSSYAKLYLDRMNSSSKKS